jgi:hypothetical protein
MALGAAVSPALLGVALARKCFLGLVLGGVGDLAQLARPSDAAPFSDEAPCAEQVGLHVEDIEAGHAARVVGAGERYGGHAAAFFDKREIVAMPTL